MEEFSTFDNKIEKDIYESISLEACIKAGCLMVEPDLMLSKTNRDCKITFKIVKNYNV